MENVLAQTCAFVKVDSKLLVAHKVNLFFFDLCSMQMCFKEGGYKTHRLTVLKFIFHAPSWPKMYQINTPIMYHFSDILCSLEQIKSFGVPQELPDFFCLLIKIQRQTFCIKK